MKIYINKYRNHWLSPYTILEKVFFWREIDYHEPLIERWSDRLKPLCVVLQRVLDVVHPKIDYVKIDRWDTWSMDHTLALIILPMLKQLNETKHGAPFTHDEDVPEHLRSTNSSPKENEWDIDDLHFKRWEWILGEMIFAFECQLNEDWDEEFWTGTWGDTVFEESDVEFPNPITGVMEKTYQMHLTGDRVCDWEARRVVEERIQNGLRLFGVYYRSLWD
jgi:hypothetical protein